MRTIHGYSSGAEDSLAGLESSISASTFAGLAHNKSVMSAYEACAMHIQRGELTVSSSGLFWLQTDPARGCNTL
jgi:hypothetical protein